MTKFIISLAIIALSFAIPEEYAWKKDLNKLSAKPSMGKKIILLPVVKAGNSKMRVAENIITETFQTLLACDFLAHINTLGPGSSMKTFAHCKFPYGANAGTAYIFESRFADDVSHKSEFVRYYLITISATGEWVDQTLLTQGGTYFFVNSDLGSCAQSEEANAMCNQMKGWFVINKDMSISSARSSMTSDVKVDEKNNILKTITEGTWSEEEVATYSVNADGTIASK